jgi:hypothetical protein
MQIASNSVDWPHVLHLLVFLLDLESLGVGPMSWKSKYTTKINLKTSL